MRLPDIERGRIARLIELGYYLNYRDFLRDAVRSKLRELELIIVRTMDIQAARREVHKFIQEPPHVFADEIVEELYLDVETMVTAINTLIEEKKIEEAI